MNIKTIIKKALTVIAGIVVYSAGATAQGKSEATIEFSYLKKADMSKSASAIVKAKNKEEKFVSAKNVLVNFYVLNKTGLQLIKSVKTDYKGVAVISLQNDLPLDDSLYFTIVAKIENDSLYEDVEEKVHLKDAALTINLDLKDTAICLQLMRTKLPLTRMAKQFLLSLKTLREIRPVRLQLLRNWKTMNNSEMWKLKPMHLGALSWKRKKILSHGHYGNHMHQYLWS